MASINLGKILLMPRGAWSSTETNYKFLDLVEYNGSGYVVIIRTGSVPVGTLPTNTAYYRLVVRKGDIGSSGMPLGVAVASTNPGVPTEVGVNWIAKAGLTYTNFKDASNTAISIPTKVGSQYVIDARLIWNGASWNATWGLVDEPVVDTSSLVNKTDIVNDLTTGGSTKPLSAEQGKFLNALFSQSDGILQQISLDSITHAFVDKNGKAAAYIDINGFWTALKYAINTIPNGALKMFNGVFPGYEYVLWDEKQRYVIAVKSDGTVVVPKLEANISLPDGSITVQKLADNLKSTMPWYGKNILFIGDSVTAANKYQTTVAKNTGANVFNHAKGGIGLTNMVNGDGNGFAPLTVDDVTGKDLIVVFGSLNDRGSLIGQKTDMYPGNNTIYGKVNFVISTIYGLLQTAGNKKARLAFIAPHKVGKYSYNDSNGGQEYPAGSGQTLETIVEAIKYACGFYGLPVIDLYHNSGINNYTWDVLTSNLPGNSGEPYPSNLDNVHPNDDGYALIGRYIASQLNRI